MQLSRLLVLGPNVVRPGKLKLELILTSPVALFRFKADTSLFYSIWLYFYLFEVREWWWTHSWYISCVCRSENWCKLVVEDVGLSQSTSMSVATFSQWRNADWITSFTFYEWSLTLSIWFYVVIQHCADIVVICFTTFNLTFLLMDL